MKINEFSNKYNVSYDTIRYYMKLNLIIPEKKGGYYYFNKECEREMKEISKLKRMDFSLQEIKNIFNFKRIGKLTSYQQNNYYQSLYKEKVDDIEAKIGELTKAKDELEEKIADLVSNNNDVMTTIGIDLAALSLFSCPRCNNDLLLTAEKVESNQVIEGSLNCDCGEILLIKEGILYANNLDKNIEQVEDNHIEEYIKNTNPEFIDESYHSLEWLHRQLEFESLSGKVIMEPGSGYGHFLRQIYSKLSDDTIYICVDNRPQINQYLKQLLEMTGKRLKIIFISANLPELPLKENIVDLLIDFTGTSCFSFENKGFLPQLLERYLKKQTVFLATFIIYHKFGPNNNVSEPYRKNFNYNNIKDRLLKMSFVLEKEYRSECQTVQNSMGKFESFAQLGDQIYSYQVKAKRLS